MVELVVEETGSLQASQVGWVRGTFGGRRFDQGIMDTEARIYPHIFVMVLIMKKEACDVRKTYTHRSAPRTP